jgi:hypothetical protein
MNCTEKIELLYAERPIFWRMSEFIDSSLHDCRVVSVVVQEAKWTAIQKAVVSLAPVGMSVVCSIRELVRIGYIPAARMLVRPLIERVATTEYLIQNPEAIDLWNLGRPRKGWPKLAALLSYLEKGHPNDYAIYKNFVDELNEVVHPDALGDRQFLAPNSAGQMVYWFDQVPTAYDLADNICAANMMAAVFFASQSKHVFIYNR